MRAIMAGTFDPITNGHVDLAERASHIFDEVTLAVYRHAKKNMLFSPEERVSLAEDAVSHRDNVKVRAYSGLLVEFADSIGAQVLIRGLRATSDFDYEFQLAAMNKRMAPRLESMFFLADIRHTFLSSSIVKEIAQLGGDVSDLVPESASRALKLRYAQGVA